MGKESPKADQTDDVETNDVETNDVETEDVKTEEVVALKGKTNNVTEAETPGKEVANAHGRKDDPGVEDGRYR